PDPPAADRTGPPRRPGPRLGRRRRPLRGHRGQRGVPRQAAARPPPDGLRDPGRTHGRRDPRAGPEDADPRRDRLHGPGPLSMQKIVVEGGVPLRGEVRVSGAKNAVLPILCAGLLADGPLLVRNVPNLQDVKTTIRVLAELGAGIRLDDAF